VEAVAIGVGDQGQGAGFFFFKVGEPIVVGIPAGDLVEVLEMEQLPGIVEPVAIGVVDHGEREGLFEEAAGGVGAADADGDGRAGLQLRELAVGDELVADDFEVGVVFPAGAGDQGVGEGVGRCGIGGGQGAGHGAFDGGAGDGGGGELDVGGGGRRGGGDEFEAVDRQQAEIGAGAGERGVADEEVLALGGDEAGGEGGGKGGRVLSTGAGVGLGGGRGAAGGAVGAGEGSGEGAEGGAAVGGDFHPVGGVTFSVSWW
jgi:hypothetical protein